LARTFGIAIGRLVYLLHGKLRRVGLRNLEMAFPEKSASARRKIVRGVFTSLGRQFAEICLFPRYTRENVSKIVTYDGFENFDRASERGKGVLFLTGHVGGWELSAFSHSLYGHPLHFVMRPLDNPYLDALVRRYRTMHDNIPILKHDPVRELLRAMKAGATVGILMDTNMTPPEGVFVDTSPVEDASTRPACIVLKQRASTRTSRCDRPPTRRSTRSEQSRKADTRTAARRQPVPGPRPPARRSFAACTDCMDVWAGWETFLPSRRLLYKSHAARTERGR